MKPELSSSNQKLSASRMNAKKDNRKKSRRHCPDCAVRVAFYAVKCRYCNNLLINHATYYLIWLLVAVALFAFGMTIILNLS